LEAELAATVVENEHLQRKLADTVHGLDEALYAVREAHAMTSARLEDAQEVIETLREQGKDGEDELAAIKELHSRIQFEQSTDGQRKKWKRLRMVYAQDMKAGGNKRAKGDEFYEPRPD
jgi:signal transduction histidine kinase